jgi:adenylylsulfate reductase subunit A
MKGVVLQPLKTYEENMGKTTDPNINPNYITPKMFMFRLQKIMDEYAGGVSVRFTTTEPLLKRALELLALLKEDQLKLGAKDVHDLMRAWENTHRLYQAEVHVRSIMFRQETRWPGYYFRADKPTIDDQNWKAFVNARLDPKTEQWEMKKIPVKTTFA